LDKRIISLNANLTVEYIQVAIANTFGVENSDELTTSGIIVEASSREGDNFSGSFDFMYTRTLKEINAVELAKEVCKRAIYNLNKSKVSSMNTTVILDPICVSSVVGESIAAGLNAENVQKKRSFLSEDIGSQVFSEKLNIIDDGTIADGIGSLNFDAEGYPSRRNVLIDKGKIISLMHNSYTAKKENKESTGNAIRGSTFWDYSSLPSISPRNLIVEKGNKKIEDMISDLKKGILIRYTGDSPNIVTGDFTGIINEGYYVENGEIKFSIVEATFSGKIKSMLKNIVELSSDLKT
jgi:Predicted Zn-dependent proteases and their inactivated homologs